MDRYSKGGTTREVPAMLTSGEYGTKKIVDKIGVNELNKINQTGSLEELYDKPNEDNFELFETSDMVSPPIMRFRDGGSLKITFNLKIKINKNILLTEYNRP